MVLAGGLYEVLSQEVKRCGEWREDYLEGREGPGSCPVLFNVRIFTYRVSLHIAYGSLLFHVIPTHYSIATRIPCKS